MDIEKGFIRHEIQPTCGFQQKPSLMSCCFKQSDWSEMFWLFWSFLKEIIYIDFLLKKSSNGNIFIGVVINDKLQHLLLSLVVDVEFLKVSESIVIETFSKCDRRD